MLKEKSPKAKTLWQGWLLTAPPAPPQKLPQATPGHFAGPFSFHRRNRRGLKSQQCPMGQSNPLCSPDVGVKHLPGNISIFHNAHLHGPQRRGDFTTMEQKPAATCISRAARTRDATLGGCTSAKPPLALGILRTIWRAGPEPCARAVLPSS